MSGIAPILGSHHQVLQSIRQREIRQSTDKISSGNRFASDIGQDSAALRLSTRLEAKKKISQATTGNLQNAYQLIQYQTNILRYAERTITRMNELAYQASDIITSSVDRRHLNSEFKAHVEVLKDILYDRTFDKVMFDPLQSDNIASLDVSGASGGPDVDIMNIDDFGSLGGEIQLWWESLQARDRIRIYQGDRWFFDSGEYASDVDLNGDGYATIPGTEYRMNDGTTKTNADGTQSPVWGDKFTMTFQPGQMEVVADSDNTGNANEYMKLADTDGDGYGDLFLSMETLEGYPRFRAPSGDSSNLRITVNEAGAEDILRESSTAWNYFLKIDKDYIQGPTVTRNEFGDNFTMDTVGFSTLEAYDLESTSNAANAMTATTNELESLKTQLGFLAKTFSELRFNKERIEVKSMNYANSHGVITDSDMASEATKLARNLLVQEATNNALIHSRVSARNVYKLIM